MAATWTLEFPYRRSVGSGDRRLSHRAARPQGRRRAHGRRSRARAAVRVRPRYGRRGRRHGRGGARRESSYTRRGSSSRCGRIRWTVRSRGRWCGSTAPTRRCCTRSTAAAPIARSPAHGCASAGPRRPPAISPTSSASSWRRNSGGARAVHVAPHRGGVQDPRAVAAEHPLRPRSSRRAASSATSARSAARSTCRRAATARSVSSRRPRPTRSTSPTAARSPTFSVITPLQYQGQEETEDYVQATILLDGADTTIMVMRMDGIAIADVRTRPARAGGVAARRTSGRASAVQPSPAAWASATRSTSWEPTGEPDLAASSRSRSTSL